MSVALAGTVDSGTPGWPATNRRTCPSCRVATAVVVGRGLPTVLELLRGGGSAAAAQGRCGQRLHPVHDDAGERHPLALETVDEVGRLT